MCFFLETMFCSSQMCSRSLIQDSNKVNLFVIWFRDNCYISLCPWLFHYIYCNQLLPRASSQSIYIEILLYLKIPDELTFLWKRFLVDLLKYHNNGIPDSADHLNLCGQLCSLACWGRWEWDSWMNSRSFTDQRCDLEQTASYLGFTYLCKMG